MSHPDLVAVVVLAAGAVGVVVVPVPAPVRAIVGLAFLLVAPGYATTVALFPAARGPATPTRLERFGLTIVASTVLAGTLAIGVTLVGIQLTSATAVGGLAGWTFLAAGGGATRRSTRAGERIDPRAVSACLRAAVGRSRESRVAIALVVLAVVGAGVAGALVTVEFRTDPYTELGFVEGPRLTTGGTVSATIAIENHEGRAVTYTLVAIGQRATRTSDGVRVRASRQVTRVSRRVAAGARWQASITGRIENGTTRLAVHLYVDTAPTDGAPGARLHWWRPTATTAA